MKAACRICGATIGPGGRNALSAVGAIVAKGHLYAIGAAIRGVSITAPSVAARCWLQEKIYADDSLAVVGAAASFVRARGGVGTSRFVHEDVPLIETTMPKLRVVDPQLPSRRPRRRRGGRRWIRSLSASSRIRPPVRS